MAGILLHMSTSSPPPRPKPLGPPGIRGLPLIVALGALVTLIGLILLIGSGAGLRFGLWQVRIASGLMWTGAWIGLVGGLLSVLAAAMTRPGTRYRGFSLAVIAALIGLTAFGALVYWHLTLKAPPPSPVTGPAASISPPFSPGVGRSLGRSRQAV
jgi:hypothetical protein